MEKWNRKEEKREVEKKKRKLKSEKYWKVKKEVKRSKEEEMGKGKGLKDIKNKIGKWKCEKVKGHRIRKRRRKCEREGDKEIKNRTVKQG